MKMLLGLMALGALGITGVLIFLWLQHGRAVVLPLPSGRYAVGRVEGDWVNDARAETRPADPDTKRELMPLAWYPAAPVSQPGPPTEYLPAKWRQARLPGWGARALLLARRLASVRVHAIADAPLAPARRTYPVLIMQPGLGRLVTDYTALAEALASHGYIVLGLTPNYSAGVALDELIAGWAGHSVFVLNQLEHVNGTESLSMFAGRLDLDSVGVLGHSVGGAAAAEACRLDSRFKAGVDIDGFPHGNVVKTGLSQPFMFIWSEPADDRDGNWQEAVRDTHAIYRRLQRGGYQIMIRGARHFNFADDAVLYSPAEKTRRALGSIDGQRGLKITTDYVRAFFDHYLKGTDEPLLTGASSAYPEVVFQSRGRVRLLERRRPFLLACYRGESAVTHRHEERCASPRRRKVWSPPLLFISENGPSVQMIVRAGSTPSRDGIRSADCDAVSVRGCAAALGRERDQGGVQVGGGAVQPERLQRVSQPGNGNPPVGTGHRSRPDDGA